MFWQVVLGLIPPSSLKFCSWYVFAKNLLFLVFVPFFLILFFYCSFVLVFVFLLLDPPARTRHVGYIKRFGLLFTPGIRMNIVQLKY